MEKKTPEQRKEYVNWAKKRSLAYLEKGELENAITSIQTDFNNDDSTSNHVCLMLLPAVDRTNEDSVKLWIEGIN